MAFDYNTLVPLNQINGRSSGDPTKVEDTSALPAYVKEALARQHLVGDEFLNPDRLASSPLYEWMLNGQKNYAVGLPGRPTQTYTVDAGENGSSSYQGLGERPTTGDVSDYFAIPVPFSGRPNAQALPEDLPMSFYGSTVNGDGGGGAAYTATADGVNPTDAAIKRAYQIENERSAATKVSPFLPLTPLFPLLVGGGAMALGAAGLGSAGAGGAAAGSGVGMAAELGALGTGALGAGEAGLGVAGAGAGIGGTIPEGATIGMYPAAASGVPGGSLGLGAGGAGGTGGAGGAVGGGMGLGAAAEPGMLASGYNWAINGVAGVLESLGVSPELAASIAPIATKSIIGGGVGALTSGISGGDPLKGGLTGALGGGLVGAFGGAEGPLASMLGVSGGAADAIIGAGVGGLGSYAQGQDPLTGALAGGIAGYGSNALIGGDTLTGAAGLGASEALKGNGAAESGTGGLFGTGKGINGTTLALGALAGGATLLGNKGKSNTTAATTTTGTTPGPGSVSGALGPYFNKNLNYDVSGRTVLDPYFGKTPSYWSYGGTPEKQFFGNNSLKAFGFADGGYVDEEETYPTYDGRPFSTEEGDSHVRGPGTGTSDSIDAKLSDGEYVLNFRDVTDIGGGQNDRGAAKLDRLRKSGALARFLASVE